MATTIVPKPGRPAKGVTVRKIQKEIYGWLLAAQGDADKSSELYDASYYQGSVDICNDILLAIETPAPARKLGDKKLFALVPAAILINYLLVNNRKAKNA